MRRLIAAIFVLVLLPAVPLVGAAAAAHAPARHRTWIVAEQSSSGAWVSPHLPGVRWYTTNRPSGAHAIPIFTSISGFRHALSQHAIGRAEMVAFDPEKWSRTPLAEQRHPVKAMQAFIALAHRHHLGSIVAPGRDLSLAPGAPCAKFTGETLDQAFLACGLTFGAVGATYLVLQAAPEESTQSTYVDLVREVEQQLHLASPHTHLLVTLSTGMLGLGPLASLARRTLEYASGLEVNTSSSGLPVARKLLSEVAA